MRVNYKGNPGNLLAKGIAEEGQAEAGYAITFTADDLSIDEPVKDYGTATFARDGIDFALEDDNLEEIEG